MKVKRIYSLPMAEYLQTNGLNPIKVLPDLIKENKSNWIFEDTPELQELMTRYTESRHQ